MLLNKEEILNAEDMTYEEVDVPEWNGSVKVRTMSGFDRDNFEASLFDEKSDNQKANLKNMRAKLLSCCIVGEDNEIIFSSKDVEALGKKSSKALDRVYEIASKLNGIGAKEEEELTKN